jgi:hypothetical protein
VGGSVLKQLQESPPGGTGAGCLRVFNEGLPFREFASALGTVGLSVGVTSPDMPDIALWAEIIAMFLGRLEFMAMIVSAIKLGRDLGRLAA